MTPSLRPGCEVGTGAPSRPRPAQSVYLHPGQLFASAEPASVTTVLGSCVSTCLWDRVRGIGGINHYALPFWAGNGVSSSNFGNVAMPALLERLLALGAGAGDLEAKVFGGACVIGPLPHRERRLGAQNVERAMTFLREKGVLVASRDTGGTWGRKLVFHTATGVAWLKQL